MRLASLVVTLALVGVMPRAAGGADTTDRQTRTIPLPAGRVLELAVTVGEIQVTGWDRAEAALEVTREAPSQAALAALPVVVDESAQRVRVAVVQTDGGKDPAWRGTIVARIPRDAVVAGLTVFEGRVRLTGLVGAVTASVSRGPIEARAVAGRLRLETGIGSVVLREARLTPDGLLRLRAFNGDVRLGLAERPSDARILAVALNGRVHSSVPLTMKDQWGPRFGEATLGNGVPLISIDVVTGRVEITEGPARDGPP